MNLTEYTDKSIHKELSLIRSWLDLEDISGKIDDYDVDYNYDYAFVANGNKPNPHIQELFKKSFLDGMIEVFQPKGFKIYKPKNFYKVLNKNMNNEIWFDSPAMLVNPSIIEDLIEYYKK
jgi:hypothetical protein